jgi:hypothetical protein
MLIRASNTCIYALVDTHSLHPKLVQIGERFYFLLLFRFKKLVWFQFSHYLRSAPKSSSTFSETLELGSILNRV